MLPTINYLTDIHFAPGIRSLLPQLCAQRNITRPLLVTDEGITAAGLVDLLPLDFAAVFAAVQPNPTTANVTAGLELYRRHNCDAVIALGGGSPIDCGKAIALLVTHPGPLEQYALIRGGLGRITADKPPVIAIPTTAGTGSEVGRAALITFDARTKLAIIGKPMIPDIAVCDPELTLGLPPQLTAATGMDAISHCVETFCSPKFNPVADAIALDGLARATRNLSSAVSDGNNLQARTEMLMASLQGALAFQKGLGMIHSLSHPLGALPLRLHHGTLNSIFLPHVLRFNSTACPQKITQMCEAVGCHTGNDPGDSLARWFEAYTRNLNIPQTLSQLHVTTADVEPLATAAHADHSTPTNPRGLTSDDCRTLYHIACS